MNGYGCNSTLRCSDVGQKHVIGHGKYSSHFIVFNKTIFKVNIGSPRVLLNPFLDCFCITIHLSNDQQLERGGKLFESVEQDFQTFVFSNQTEEQKAGFIRIEMVLGFE